MTPHPFVCPGRRQRARAEHGVGRTTFDPPVRDPKAPLASLAGDVLTGLRLSTTGVVVGPCFPPLKGGLTHVSLVMAILHELVEWGCKGGDLRVGSTLRTGSDVSRTDQPVRSQSASALLWISGLPSLGMHAPAETAAGLLTARLKGRASGLRGGGEEGL